MLSQLGLAVVPDPLYVSDSPQPLTLRSIQQGSTRLIGALQSAP